MRSNSHFYRQTKWILQQKESVVIKRAIQSSFWIELRLSFSQKFRDLENDLVGSFQPVAGRNTREEIKQEVLRSVCVQSNRARADLWW